MQLQFKDRVRLNTGERFFRIELGRASGGVDVDFLAGEVSHQILAGFGAVSTGTDDGDDVVQVIERGQIAFENVLAVLCLLQQVGGGGADNIDAVIDKVLDRLDKAHFLGLSIHHRQEDHAETFLHRGVLEELVEHNLRLATTLQLDDNAHSIAITLVTNVRNVVDHLIVYQLCNPLDEPLLADLIRNLGDDNGLAIFVEGLNACLGPHHEAAAASSVSFEDSRFAVDDAVGREVRAFYDFQNLW